ncbi:restriction endonuclease [Candidatus Micrarchaeota archaeon]|nr:restriction endonuclease [Candidatus Micrarchaeota archaeon]
MVSFKKAAYEILKESDEPLTAKEITDTALQEGFIKTEGQTPEATMAAQLYIDINGNKESPFIKVGRGHFSLKQKDSLSSPLPLLEKQNEKVKQALKEELLKMDPYQFEYLIRDLLQEIGYENVTVTKRSGDGGIDLLANLAAGGLTNIKTAVQAKRFKNNVSGKVITQLRGSAEIGQRGLVVTTSDFTKDAILEAKAQSKTPIGLVNGDKLITLLFKHGVGVKKEEKTIFSLDKEYFHGETSTLKKSLGSEKNKSIWPLPGGTHNYVDTLNKFLEAVNGGINKKTKLVEWYKNNFENVQSDKTAEGYIFVPKSMGLVDIRDGQYSLTEDGKKYLHSKDLNRLYEIISKNIFAFDEINEFLKTSKEPKNEQELLDYLNENLDAEWTSFAQTNFRLLWLINLKKIKKIEGGYIITNQKNAIT